MLILGNHCNINKGLEFALKAVYGINQTTAINVCARIGVRPNVKLKNIKPGRLEKLNKICRDNISTSLSRRTRENIKDLIDVKHYKGVRHMFGLPCRGQRTRTNASTAKRLSVIKRFNPKKSPTRGLKHKRK